MRTQACRRALQCQGVQRGGDGKEGGRVKQWFLVRTHSLVKHSLSAQSRVEHIPPSTPFKGLGNLPGGNYHPSHSTAEKTEAQNTLMTCQAIQPVAVLTQAPWTSLSKLCPENCMESIQTLPPMCTLPECHDLQGSPEVHPQLCKGPHRSSAEKLWTNGDWPSPSALLIQRPPLGRPAGHPGCPLH